MILKLFTAFMAVERRFPPSCLHPNMDGGIIYPELLLLQFTVITLLLCPRVLRPNAQFFNLVTNLITEQYIRARSTKKNPSLPKHKAPRMGPCSKYSCFHRLQKRGILYTLVGLYDVFLLIVKIK